MRMQFEDCRVNGAERGETFRQRGEQKGRHAEQAATPDSWQVPYRKLITEPLGGIITQQALKERHLV